jgi:hypothetical protein
MIDEDDFWSNWWNENWQGKPMYSEKTFSSATLSTTKFHMTRPGLEPWTTAVGSQRLTAWAIARPTFSLTLFLPHEYKHLIPFILSLRILSLYIIFLHTVRPLFNVPWFKVSPYVLFYFHSINNLSTGIRLSPFKLFLNIVWKSIAAKRNRGVTVDIY